MCAYFLNKFFFLYTLFYCVSVIKAPPPSVGVLNVMIYCLLPVTMVSVALLTAIWMYRHRKPPYGHVDITEVKLTNSKMFH